MIYRSRNLLVSWLYRKLTRRTLSTSNAVFILCSSQFDVETGDWTVDHIHTQSLVQSFTNIHTQNTDARGTPRSPNDASWLAKHKINSIEIDFDLNSKCIWTWTETVYSRFMWWLWFWADCALFSVVVVVCICWLIRKAKSIRTKVKYKWHCVRMANGCRWRQRRLPNKRLN